MKHVWNAVCLVCFINVVALLGFTGWLANSGRLNPERVRGVRAIFEETVAEQRAREERIRQEALRESDGVEVALPSKPPLTAEEQLALRALQSAGDRQRIQRLEREVADLRAALQRERALVDAQRADFEAEKAEFYRMRREIVQTEGDEQFRKSLVTLESVSPKAAKDMLLAMIQGGDRDGAVGYLNAMQDRSRSKIIGELVKATETELAADLLEQLRIRGVGDVPPEAQSE
ncbi:MAG: hypothetical protein ACF8Q5_09070 [Phycisphaerales bacterium JB040]